MSLLKLWTVYKAYLHYIWSALVVSKWNITVDCNPPRIERKLITYGNLCCIKLFKHILCCNTVIIGIADVFDAKWDSDVCHCQF